MLFGLLSVSDCRMSSVVELLLDVSVVDFGRLRRIDSSPGKLNSVASVLRHLSSEDVHEAPVVDEA